MSPAFLASLALGRAHFEAGRYHEAHEAWELGWRRTNGEERTVLQALILWATAVFHHRRGRPRGTHRLLVRALERLGEVREGFEGLDVEALREALVASLEAAQAPFDEAQRPGWFAVAEDERPFTALEHAASCPYCGEPVLVQVAAEDATGARYVEDCPVCCRPWSVVVSCEDDRARVELGREGR